MKAIKLSLAILFLAPFALLAQPNDAKKCEKRQAKVIEQEFEYIKQKNFLTEQEFADFTVLYKEFNKKNNEIKRANRKIKQEFKKQELSDEQIKANINTIADNHIAIANLEKEYINKYLTVVPAKKTTQIITTLRDFKKELLKEIRQDKKENKKEAKRQQRGKKGPKPQ